jgi:histidinol-phosphate aminotransferase
MKSYSSARDEFTDFEVDYVFLDANESPFPNGWNRYPDPQQLELKQVLSQQNTIPKNQILLGNGSDEVLDLLFRAFCEPNIDNVLTLPPTYGMYGVLANLNAIENREVLLKTDFQPDVNQIFENVDDRTKMIFLCSPNNPTGNTFSDDKVIAILKNFKGLVVIDEAYIDFSGKESWMTNLKEYPNLVITQTLSKAYGLASLRIGIAYASIEIIRLLNKIKPPYNINLASQNIALKKLNFNVVPNQIKKIVSERKRVELALQSISFIEKIFPSEANFLLIKVDDANLRYQQLLKRRAVVRNRSSQPLCNNCLRISIGTKDENNQLLTILSTI